MNDLTPQQIGKFIIITGIALIITGTLLIAGTKLGLFKLPGDITVHGKNWKIYLPIATCIIISIILTIIMWIFR